MTKRLRYGVLVGTLRNLRVLEDRKESWKEKRKSNWKSVYALGRVEPRNRAKEREREREGGKGGRGEREDKKKEVRFVLTAKISWGKRGWKLKVFLIFPTITRLSFFLVFSTPPFYSSIPVRGNWNDQHLRESTSPTAEGAFTSTWKKCSVAIFSYTKPWIVHPGEEKYVGGRG